MAVFLGEVSLQQQPVVHLDPVPVAAGFNPVFGPAWVNLYGSPQNSALQDVHKALNEGMGEGIFYRGRILMAITVEIFSSPSIAERKLGDKTKHALSKLKLKKKSKKSKEKAKSLRQLHGEEETGGCQEAEQPEEVTVEVEEIHPLPEVSPAVPAGLRNTSLWHAWALWRRSKEIIHWSDSLEQTQCAH